MLLLRSRGQWKAESSWNGLVMVYGLRTLATYLVFSFQSVFVMSQYSMSPGWSTSTQQVSHMQLLSSSIIWYRYQPQCSDDLGIKVMAMAYSVYGLNALVAGKTH